MVAISSPEPVQFVDVTRGSNHSVPKLVGGMAIKTLGGMVNVPLPAGTKH